jgi:hypothetical protein
MVTPISSYNAMAYGNQPIPISPPVPEAVESSSTAGITEQPPIAGMSKSYAISLHFYQLGIQLKRLREHFKDRQVQLPQANAIDSLFNGKSPSAPSGDDPQTFDKWQEVISLVKQVLKTNDFEKKLLAIDKLFVDKELLKIHGALIQALDAIGFEVAQAHYNRGDLVASLLCLDGVGDPFRSQLLSRIEKDPLPNHVQFMGDLDKAAAKIYGSLKNSALLLPFSLLIAKHYLSMGLLVKAFQSVGWAGCHDISSLKIKEQFYDLILANSENPISKSVKLLEGNPDKASDLIRQVGAYLRHFMLEPKLGVSGLVQEKLPESIPIPEIGYDRYITFQERDLYYAIVGLDERRSGDIPKAKQVYERIGIPALKQFLMDFAK